MANQTKISPAIEQQYMNEMDRAVRDGDQAKQDQICRSYLHFQNRGREIDTSKKDTLLVKALCPQFNY